MTELTATQKVKLLTAQIEQMKVAHEAEMKAERIHREQLQRALSLFRSAQGNFGAALKELEQAME